MLQSLRRKALQDPARGLFRTHVPYLPGAGPTVTELPDRLQPITFALDLTLSGVAPNGILFEFGGSGTAGTALWLDSATGTLGFAAGTVLATPNDGVSATVVLSHLSATGATVSAGGTGHAVNDVITLAGGTFARAASLRVTGVAGGVITTAAVEDPGLYSVPPANPVAQGSTTGAGVNATFTMTFGLNNARRQRVVCGVSPGTGEISIWIDGHLRARAASGSGSFGVNGWAAGPGDMGIGAVVGTVTDRVPTGARVALADAAVTGYLSVYANQRPRQHAKGRLGL